MEKVGNETNIRKDIKKGRKRRRLKVRKNFSSDEYHNIFQ
jgi:hypothetical protein